MRVIRIDTLRAFWSSHQTAEKGLRYWYSRADKETWSSTTEVQAAFPKAKVLNAERVRFQITGGKYRLIAAFDFRHAVCWIKFIGTHAEYNKVNALTIDLYGSTKK